MSRILLLEPNHILAQQYKRYLQSRGYLVDVCHDAQTAVVSADKYTPDIVVMELLLSSHSGIEFLYEFRSYSEWTKVPVLLLSRVPAQDIGIDAKMMTDLGIGEVAYKPDLSMEKLSAKIAKLTGVKSSPR